jgi:O-antigen/teichoic acid export membrane protein
LGLPRRRARPAQDLRQTLIANVALAGLGFVTGVTAARLLGPTGRGDLAAIQLWPGVLAVLAMLGMSDALAFFSAKDGERVNVYLTTAIGVALVSSILFVAGGIFIIPLALHSYPADVVSAAQRYLLLVPLYALVLLPCHVLRGMTEFGWWNILRVAPSVAWLLVLATAAILGTASPGGLADGNLIALAVLGIAVAVVVLRKVPGPYRSGTAEARKLLRFGLPAAGAFVPQLLNLRLDQLIMAAVLPARSLGLYVVAVAWSSAVNPLLFAIGMVLLPKVAGAPDHEVRQQILVRTVRIGVWVAAGTVLIVAVLTPLAFRLLFSNAYRPAVPAAIVLVVAGGLFGLNFILAEGIRGLGRPAITLYAEVGGLVLTGASLALLLRPFGIVGAAWGSVVGYGTVTAGLLSYLRREMPDLRGSILTGPALRETMAACLRFVRRHPDA